MLLSSADDLDVVEPVCVAFVFRLNEFYARVCVGRMSSPSQAFRETAHLVAFLFASFSNAYETIFDDIPTYFVLDFP